MNTHIETKAKLHAVIDGRDLGPISEKMIELMADHLRADAINNEAEKVYDRPTQTTEEKAEAERTYIAEIVAAMRIILYLHGRGTRSADEVALMVHSDQCHNTTLGTIGSLNTGFIRAIAQHYVPDDSEDRAVRSLIEDHREANAIKGARADHATDEETAAYTKAMRDERRAAVLLCARLRDGDITPGDEKDFDAYAAVYGQDDQHSTSITWARHLPADALFCLRQHYLRNVLSYDRSEALQRLSDGA